jgi:hypothetical protein
MFSAKYCTNSLKSPFLEYEVNCCGCGDVSTFVQKCDDEFYCASCADRLCYVCGECEPCANAADYKICECCSKQTKTTCCLVLTEHHSTSGFCFECASEIPYNVPCSGCDDDMREEMAYYGPGKFLILSDDNKYCLKCQ